MCGESSLGQRRRLPAEPLPQPRVQRRVRSEHLDRHRPVEVCVDGGEDDAHPAVPEHAGHSVAADGVPHLRELAHGTPSRRASTASRNRRMMVVGNTSP